MTTALWFGVFQTLSGGIFEAFVVECMALLQALKLMASLQFVDVVVELNALSMDNDINHGGFNQVAFGHFV